MNKESLGDGVPPVVVISYPIDETVYSVDAVTEFSFKVTDKVGTLSSCGYELNSPELAPLIKSVTLGVKKTVTGITPVLGINTLVVSCRDNANNVGSHSITFNVSCSTSATSSCFDTDTISYTLSNCTTGKEDCNTNLFCHATVPETDPVTAECRCHNETESCTVNADCCAADSTVCDATKHCCPSGEEYNETSGNCEAVVACANHDEDPGAVGCCATDATTTDDLFARLALSGSKVCCYSDEGIDESTNKCIKCAPSGEPCGTGCCSDLYCTDATLGAEICCKEGEYAKQDLFTLEWSCEEHEPCYKDVLKCNFDYNTQQSSYLENVSCFSIPAMQSCCPVNMFNIATYDYENMVKLS